MCELCMCALHVPYPTAPHTPITYSLSLPHMCMCASLPTSSVIKYIQTLTYMHSCNHTHAHTVQHKQHPQTPSTPLIHTCHSLRLVIRACAGVKMVLVCVCDVCLDTVRFVVGHGLLCVLLHKVCVVCVCMLVHVLIRECEHILYVCVCGDRGRRGRRTSMCVCTCIHACNNFMHECNRWLWYT